MDPKYEELKKQVNNLENALLTSFKKRVDGIENLFLNHRHKGFDKSKALSLAGLVFAGSVNADGSALDLPTGWTSSKTGTGLYTITHSLGNADYRAVMMAAGSQAGIFYNTARNANDVRCGTVDAGGTLADCAFDFILVPTI